MGKLYDALQIAQQQRLAKKNELNHTDTEDSSSPPPSPPPISIPRYYEEQELLGLAQTIAKGLPHPDQNVIQFIGSRLGEGTSTLIREFALTSSQNSRKPVLLVEADFHRPTQYQAFGIPTKPPLDYVLKAGQTLEGVISQVGTSNLYLATLSTTMQQSLTERSFFHSTDMWKSAREQFSLILIDSSPVGATKDSLAFCATVDGVILVLEAEKTRSSVAHSVKNQIVAREGNLLGIVYTKRKLHIPKFFYKFL